MKKTLSKLIDLGKEAIRLFNLNDMDVYAGYSTLFIITAIFPLLMLLISIFNLLPGYSPANLTEFIFGFLPDLTGVKVLVQTMITNLKQQSSGLLASVSALTTLWSASAGISALQRGLKKISPESNTKMPDKVRALLFTLGFIILIPALIVSHVLGDVIIEAVNTVTDFFGISGITEIVTSVIEVSGAITLVVGFLFVLLIFTYLPGGRRTLKSQVPGTIFTGIFCAIFTMLFSFFIPRFYHSSGVYGSLASLFLMLLWLRFILTILFMGAALNSTLENRKQAGQNDPHEEGDPT